MSALLLQYVRILATQAKELPVGVCQLLIQMYPRLIICSSFVVVVVVITLFLLNIPTQ